MFHYYVNGARVEQYQQQLRLEAAGARGTAALEDKARIQVLIPGRAYVRVLVAAFKAAVTLRLA